MLPRVSSGICNLMLIWQCYASWKTHSGHGDCLHSHQCACWFSALHHSQCIYKTNSNHLLYRHVHTDDNKHLNTCHSVELCQLMQRMLCYGLRISISCCMLLHVNFNSSVGGQYSLKCCFPSCGLANKGAEIFLAMAVTVVR